MADENEIALAVMQIAASNKNHIATFSKAKSAIPKLIKLDTANLAPSTTRNGEPMWHQLLRNIKSHDQSDGNFIAEGWLLHVPRVGYQITALGLKRLKKLGY